MKDPIKSRHRGFTPHHVKPHSSERRYSFCKVWGLSQRKPRVLTRGAGFTLIEILVVVIIIGVLAALVGPRLFGKVGVAKQKGAKAQIELFGTALDIFRLDVGRYPTTEEGLKALREKPSGAERWQGPYLPKEIPLDPWGRPYIYKSPGEHGEYDLISHGLDGVEGGEGENQDIVSWKDIGG